MTIPYHPLRDSSPTGPSRAACVIWHALLDIYPRMFGYNLAIHKALDVGTGLGHVVETGHRSFGVDVVGMDLRRDVYQGPLDRFVEHDVLTLWPFPENSFDLVIEGWLFDDLVSLQKKQRAAVISHLSSEINRVVRPGGFFYTFSSSSRDLVPQDFQLLDDCVPCLLYRKS